MGKGTRDFLDRLRASRLLDAKQMGATERACARSRRPPEPKGIASHLVKLGWLTRWQAGQLLQGRSEFWLKHYKLIEPLGEGTTSEVFLAENVGLRKTVVVKLLHHELLDDPNTLERFRREIEAVASIRHPNFVMALDAGSVEDRHFFVTEYVPGRDLGAIVSETGPLPVDVACECARQAAIGLEHLASLGLVHRDMKPRNLLLTREGLDGPPVVKILDLGATRLQTGASLTRTGDFVGTPDFMAPEQIIDGKSVDCRADIFGLGATLYYLLTGSAPIEGNTILERLNYRISQPLTNLGRLRADAPHGLEEMLARMLAADPADRYPTPAAAAAALASFAENSLDDQSAVGASEDPTHPAADASSVLLAYAPSLHETPSAAPLVQEWEEFAVPSEEANVGKQTLAAFQRVVPVEPRRWLLMATLAGGAFISAGVLAAVWWFMGTATVTLDWPVMERTGGKIILDGQGRTLTSESAPLFSLSPGDHKAVVQREGYEPIAIKFSVRRGENFLLRPEWRPLPETARRHLADAVASVQGLEAGDAAVAKVQNDLWEYGRNAVSDPMSELFAAEQLARLPSDLDRLALVEGQSLDPPVQDSAGVVAVFGTRRPRMQHWGVVRSVEYGPDGLSLFSCGDDAVAKQWDSETGALKRTFHPVTSFALSADGKRLAGHHQDFVRFWEVETGAPLPDREIRRVDARKMRFVDQDRFLIVATARAEIVGYSMTTGDQSFTLERHPVFTPHPDGSRLIVANQEGQVSFVEPATGKSNRVAVRFDRPLADFAVIANGRHLAVQFQDQQSISLFDVRTGKSAGECAAFDPPKARFTADGRTMLSPHFHQIEFWDVAAQKEERTLVLEPMLSRCVAVCLGVSNNQRRFAIGDIEGGVRQFDLATRAELPDSARSLDYSVSDFAVDPLNGSLALGLKSGRVGVWDPRNGRETVLHRFSTCPHSVAVSGPTRWIAAVGLRTPIKFWDADTHVHEFDLAIDTTDVVAMMRFSPNGKMLAIAFRDGAVDVWNVEGKERIASLRYSSYNPYSLAFSPSGQALAGSSHIGPALLWSVPKGEVIHEFSAETLPAHLQFSPDGKSLIAVSQRSVVSYDIVSGMRRGSETAAYSHLPTIAVDPTGQMRVIGVEGRLQLSTLKITTAPRDLEIGPALGMVRDLGFLPNGRYLASLNGNGSVYVVRVQSPEKPAMKSASGLP